jgi:hypothetical protein
MKVTTRHVPLSERIALCDATVTLNGHPARVLGYRHPFAHVADTATGLSAEWAWETVARIVAKDGAFKS